MNQTKHIRSVPEKPKLVRQTNFDHIIMNLQTNDSQNVKIDILKYLDEYCSETLCSPIKNIKK